MTEIQKQNLISEKNGLKMELVFSDECGASVVADYTAQKEAGETPSINITTVNNKRKAIKARIQEIEDELAKN